MPNSNKGKEKETGETVLKKRLYLTKTIIKKLLSDVIKESKVHTSVGRRWRNEINYGGPGENKRKVRVTHERDANRTRKGIVEEPVPKSDKEPDSKGKKEKVEIELTREERIEVLKTQKVLSRRVFNPKVMPKLGVYDLADVVEL